MQITGGRFKGHKLYTPPSGSAEIRPLRSRIRKALFDIIGNNLEGKKILDLFSGTGALGIEALSRGAEFVVFVDFSSRSIELIKRNLDKLKETENSMVLRLRLPEDFKGLLTLSQRYNLFFDIVFITPPYEKGLSLRTLERFPVEILNEDALIVVEERSNIPLPQTLEKLHLFKKKTYGETTLHFYRNLCKSIDLIFL